MDKEFFFNLLGHGVMHERCGIEDATKTEEQDSVLSDGHEMRRRAKQLPYQGPRFAHILAFKPFPYGQ